MNDTDLITVCDKCLMASCWAGIWMCDESWNAGITQKPRAELIALGKEHPDYIRTDSEISSQCVLVSRVSPKHPAIVLP